MTVLTYLLLAAAPAVTGLFASRLCRAEGRRAIIPCLLSVFSALLLFWLVWTAAERRVFGPGALLAFFADGAPLPGKAAVLTACLGICLFLGTTGRGKAARARLENDVRKDGALWLLSFFVTAAFFAWAMRITVMSYMTNDDVIFSRAVAAIPAEGLEAASGTFLHPFFCAMLGALYAIAPDGMWYIGYHLFALFGSLAVIGRCVLLKTRGLGWPALCGCLLLFVFDSGVFLLALGLVSFTVTPAVVGSAAVALLLCRDGPQTRAARICSDAGSVVLMLLCYLQRDNAGLCVFCFYALAAAYQLAKTLSARIPDKKRRVTGLAVTVCGALILIVACGRIGDALETDRTDYWDAEYARSSVMDYLVDDLTEEQYAAAGIPPELSVLLHGWYFMDERINTETFYALWELYYAEHPATVSGAIADDPSSYISGLISSVRDDPHMLYRTLSALSLLLAAGAAFLRHGRRYWREFFTALFALGGAALLCLYLVIRGRFLTRVFLISAFPALTVMLLMALARPAEAEPAAGREKTLPAVLAGLAGLALCVSCGLSVYHVPYAAEHADRQTLFSSQWATEAYADEHPDITYITNRYDTDVDPFHSPRYPENIVLWGGMGDTALTEGRLYAADFFRADVRFMCRNPGYITFLLQYLSLDHGPVDALAEAQLSADTLVYDVRQVVPGEGYTGWYEQNGLRYWFEDGAAVSGARVIGGAEYEFAPAGRASGPVIAQTEDGTVYTTAAYSLVPDGD